MRTLTVLRLGLIPHRWAEDLQRRYVQARRREEVGDLILVGEHPPVVTLGRGGGEEDLRLPASALRARGVSVERTERGGRATYHGPGQLVLYPILRLRPGDAHSLLEALLEAGRRALAAFGIPAQPDRERPGLWVNGEKIAAVGLAVSGGVSWHGLALNVDLDLTPFSWIRPCGDPDGRVTSMARVLGRPPGREGVMRAFLEAFAALWGARLQWGFQEAPWLVAPAPQGPAVARVEERIRQGGLHTICESALCPNIGECWGSGTATFLILGDICTRRCHFCAVTTGRPAAPDPLEPLRLAETARRMGLSHVVVTSPARDDLPDGGAEQFARVIRALRRRLPEATVEVLVPDFRGSLAALKRVADARPDVLAHNLETVPRLYPTVQPRKDYRRSLGLLTWASQAGLTTKSSLILGLGENRGEVLQALQDLRRAGCRLLTLGQYLQPTDAHLPVAEYIHPVEFEWYREVALSLGFEGVAAGPLVRSSYRAGEMVRTATPRALSPLPLR